MLLIYFYLFLYKNSLPYVPVTFVFQCQQFEFATICIHYIPTSYLSN